MMYMDLNLHVTQIFLPKMMLKTNFRIPLITNIFYDRLYSLLNKMI